MKEKIVKGNLIESKENFIIILADIYGDIDGDFYDELNEKYPHVDTEIRKYIRYCKKNGIRHMGNTVMIPRDSWSLVMVDTKNNDTVIDYDKNYSYFCIIFGCTDKVNNKAIKNALYEIRKQANKLSGTVGVKYRMGVKEGGNWKNIQGMIDNILINNGCNTQYYKS